MTTPNPTPARRGRPPRSRQQADDNRLRIIAAARTLFAQAGYDGVSMRKIAQLADCSPAALYQLFPGKRQLLLHLWGEVFTQLIEALEACYRDTPPAGRLSAMCLMLIDFWLARPDDYLAIFLVEDRPDTEEDSHFVESFDLPRRLEVLRTAIVEAQARGELRAEDPHEQQSVLLCGVQGVLMNFITIPEYPWGDRDAIKRAMIRSLLAGLG